ncbi:tRNA 2-thiouridine(34) synthase MnmA [Corynebacterium ulcerans]|uniref:tRNA-specific 2-thiouridylase MnmA n=2 Tax=Corynebacterium ulcerans TaxID=65058 RepID=A0ABD0BJ14_CORUL|nr:tRNA 2-thiouridine(34) synthase MnmA [Corynebacterium ulcerans]AEG83640.1 tRNA 5-methylaminomethyl-2-thiouridylate- methyltransferase [Corynebacterium ulcerans BR-AD22]AIT88910.1 tRNA-specific 2-thiouridylase [Corynebacterium ulcerans]AIU30268.1 tRNA-specific 2-thiouridylase [Corynebacterium ulcerans]AIU91557.1 tRNA-specific 2-thiouridylase [Corynebacterium ulcerans]AKN76850.1 tRNA-specific 2-thiouridylase [Corynebacterium ulcerans FRC58]
MRVLAAMSGGVDSAVAAARAVAAGHEVVGVHLALSQDPQTVRESSRGCCSLEDSADARRVCDKLGIPFYVWDFSDRFKEDVIDDFISSYEAGETPNPCLRCNEKIKFAALLERGIALGFDAVVTGHYAQLTQPADGGDGYLRRAIDPEKDQSYVLGVLSEKEIAHCMFPVGDTVKPKIREEAAAQGFSVAKKPDSYDICFIPDGNTQAFLGRHIGLRPGMIVDTEGQPLKEHDGAWNYTIGQRKGLDIKQPAADGKPRYVTDIDAATGTVTVGSRDDLSVSRIYADRLKYLHPALSGEFSAEVQVRAHGSVVPCQVSVDSHNDTMTITLHKPLSGVARGQAAVIYLPDAGGDIVLGSGTIYDTQKATGTHLTSA